MTRDGIMQDVGEKMRGLMSGDFNPEQARALLAFVHEQIKEYCHSKVDQRVFESWLEENFLTKEDQRIFEKKLDEKLQTFHTKEDQRVFESWIKENFHTKEDQRIFEEKLDERFNALKTIFHTKEDQKESEKKLDDKFKFLEQKTDERFDQVILSMVVIMEKLESQSSAIAELNQKMGKT